LLWLFEIRAWRPLRFMCAIVRFSLYDSGICVLLFLNNICILQCLNALLLKFVISFKMHLFFGELKGLIEPKFDIILYLLLKKNIYIFVEKFTKLLVYYIIKLIVKKKIMITMFDLCRRTSGADVSTILCCQLDPINLTTHHLPYVHIFS
jgi:hypothetical protein